MELDKLKTDHISKVLISRKSEGSQHIIKTSNLVDITQEIIDLTGIPETAYTPLYEILRNAHVHGNREDSEKFIYVVLEGKKVSIFDQGDGFNHSEILDLSQRALEEKKDLHDLTQNSHGGLGLGLRLIFSYPFKVIYENGGSEVDISF